MPSRSTVQLATRRLLEVLSEAGVPVPDKIEETDGQLRAFWHDAKVAVVVDLDPGMPA